MPLFSENVEVLVEGERYVLVVREKGKTSFLSLEKNERWRYVNSILWSKYSNNLLNPLKLVHLYSDPSVSSLLL